MNENPQNGKGRKITLTARDGHEFQAWETGSTDAPRAIVVLQEIFGLTPHIRNVCAQLASEGYHVLAPALFDRIKPQTILAYDESGLNQGRKLRGHIAPEALQEDIAACAKSLRHSEPMRPVGVIGFCWGGLLTWLASTQSNVFDAAVGWYGSGIARHLNTPPHCPTQLHFGDEDPSIPHTDIQSIRTHRPEVELFLYDNAGHGFGCPDRPSFDRQATELAWTRSLEFLGQHLTHKDQEL